MTDVGETPSGALPPTRGYAKGPPKSSLTALIGPNGSGKSAVIAALEFFFGRREVDEHDCWNGRPDLSIEVALTIVDLPHPWAEQLGSFLDQEGRLRIAKRSEPSESGSRIARFVSARRQQREFQGIRMATSATEARRLYQELRDGDSFEDLPNARSQREVQEALVAWEGDHPDALEVLEDTSVRLGGGGEHDLAPLFEFVVLPAVYDAAGEATEARANIFRSLVERLVRSRLAVEDRLTDLSAETNQRYWRIIDEEGTPILRQAEEILTGRFQRWAPGAAVHLRWDGEPARLNLPALRADIAEGGFATEIGRQGHGVQRAYILALLEELASPSTLGEEADTQELPLLVLAIEEPELYQHPSRARLVSTLLGELAAPTDQPGVQVLYSTHSPYFVGLDRVESLRVLALRRATVAPETVVSRVDLDAAAAQLWEASGRQGPQFTSETLHARLRLLTETPLSEGFFAEAVVLVEGDEDRALLMAAATKAEIELEAVGISILPAHGKDNLDKPLLIFRQLGIPTYLVFDGDAGSERASPASNQRLLRLIGAEATDWPPTQVNAEWTCFEQTMQETVASEFGGDAYENALKAACARLGFIEGGSKNPIVLGDALGRLHDEGRESRTLRELMGQISDLMSR